MKILKNYNYSKSERKDNNFEEIGKVPARHEADLALILLASIMGEAEWGVEENRPIFLS